MKKCLSLMLAVVFLLLLTGCGSGTSYPDATPNIEYIPYGSGYAVSSIGLCQETDLVISPVYLESRSDGVTIEYPVVAILDSAFEGNVNLTSVRLPNSITKVGERAFYGCTGLKSVQIGDEVIDIGAEAFYNCINLQNVVFGKKTAHIGENTFSYCGFSSIQLPSSLLDIGDAAFANCDKLTAITIPQHVTEIGFSAFQGCFGLTKIAFVDDNGWYRTETGSQATGDPMDLSNSLQNKTLFVDAYSHCAWFKK